MINFIKYLFSLVFSNKIVVNEVKPVPTPTNIVKGLFSINVNCKDLVTKLFTNPMVMGGLKGTVDLDKGLHLGFPCLLHLNTNQKFSFILVDGGIRLDFDDTHPVLEAEKFFSVESDIEYVFIDRNHAVISLVGLPDFKVMFV